MEAFLKEGAALVVAVDVNAEKLKELNSERKYDYLPTLTVLCPLYVQQWHQETVIAARSI